MFLAAATGGASAWLASGASRFLSHWRGLSASSCTSRAVRPCILDRIHDQVSLSYPHPPLSEGTISLRPWSEADASCVEEASRDLYIREGFMLPPSGAEGQVHLWLEQESKWTDEGKGISLAIGINTLARQSEECC